MKVWLVLMHFYPLDDEYKIDVYDNMELNPKDWVEKVKAAYKKQCKDKKKKLTKEQKDFSWTILKNKTKLDKDTVYYGHYGKDYKPKQKVNVLLNEDWCTPDKLKPEIPGIDLLVLTRGYDTGSVLCHLLSL